MVVKRYDRPPEPAHQSLPDTTPPLSGRSLEAALDLSALSGGSRALVRGLVRCGTTAEFPGGVGIEYGPLLKTAVRPADIGLHVHEAAKHLRDHQVDLLFVPGMSGYPIGVAYAMFAEIPAILLKKSPTRLGVAYPPGSFVAPSYTDEGDFVISADLRAVDDLVGEIATRQLLQNRESTVKQVHLRLGGADDIIDKGTMSLAVSESAIDIVNQAMARFAAAQSNLAAGERDLTWTVEMAAWTTPLLKRYNRPEQLLKDRFGITPFAGVVIDRIDLDPPALAIAGLGTVLLGKG